MRRKDAASLYFWEHLRVDSRANRMPSSQTTQKMSQSAQADCPCHGGILVAFVSVAMETCLGSAYVSF